MVASEAAFENPRSEHEPAQSSSDEQIRIDKILSRSTIIWTSEHLARWRLMAVESASEGSFSHLARAANKLMDQMQKGFFVYSPDTWTPNVNLYETATSYFVCADLAGVDKEKIDVEVVEQRLTLRGNRAVPSPEFLEEESGPASSTADPPAGVKKAKLHLMEIDHGQFTREVELPADANRERITATYRSGMLWVEIPKK
jgi:HSP20 family molecular chaperone IbpA